MKQGLLMDLTTIELTANKLSKAGVLKTATADAAVIPKAPATYM